jgi:hypothetical protein
MKHLVRIVTFMGHPDNWIANDPIEVLLGGTRTVTLPPKARVWTLRKVAYDDSMSPIYADPCPFERKYRSLRELIKQENISPLVQDLPILDLDHNLRIYDDTKENQICS